MVNEGSRLDMVARNPMNLALGFDMKSSTWLIMLSVLVN